MPAVMHYPSFHRLIQRLDSKYPQVAVHLSRTSPVIDTHTVPGLIVVVVFGDGQLPPSCVRTCH
jgi:fatty acid-binding protein DegV